jgi:glycosyltransferase involved in cell wall biosynthesis
MNDSPAISVILPVFNAGQFLAMAIHSVLTQSCRDFELIIVDDASTDESAAIVASFQDARIRFFQNEKNGGITFTLNRGLDLCRGALIARMDADDIMHKDRLAKQLAFMKSELGVSVLATRIELINVDNEVTGIWNTDFETLSEYDIKRIMAKTNCVAHPSVMMRSEIVRKFRYNQNQKGAEDWDLWMRILNAGLRIAKLDEVLLQYRMHATSIMAATKNEVSLERRLMIARRIFLWNATTKFSFSAFYFLVLIAQCRTFARHVKMNMAMPIARSAKRLLTYSPFAAMRQWQEMRSAMKKWNGKRLFIFTYVHEGGAEQVHADILQALHDKEALVIITGFSLNKHFQERLNRHAQLVVIPELANHPFTKELVLEAIAAKLNSLDGAIVFGSNNEWFFDLLPRLNERVRLLYLIHAFHYQPEGNVLHKGWLKYASRIERYIFISTQSKLEFSKFCFHNNQPKSIHEKFCFISNAVHSYKAPITHQGLSVLFVGRESKEKRIELFLKIAANTLKIAPSIQFSVVGKNSNKDLPNVKFFGVLNDKTAMNRIYQDHDILLVTSDREGFPMVIMEAMANGLTIAATPVGDIPNRLRSETALITSTLAEDRTVSEMTEHLLMLSRQPDKLNDLRLNAFKFAQDSFSWETFQNAYQELLRSKN